MIIAEHLRPGTKAAELHHVLGLEVDYTPICAWPDDCLVQWGNGYPRKPFFEAFPNGNSGSFIRGDGKTLEEAERLAFDSFTREAVCDHSWSRHSEKKGTYLNGAGWCRRCDAFSSRMFEKVVVLSHWRKPLEFWEADDLQSLDEDHEMNEHMDRVYPQDRERRRKSHRLLRLRKNLFGARERTNPTPDKETT